MLNGNGPQWIWEAESQEDATYKYLKDMNYHSIDAYRDYCEELEIDSKIEWKEVV